VLDGTLFLIVLGLVANLALRVAGDPAGLFGREAAEDLLVAPAMSVALVPYLCAVAWYSRRELENLRRRFRPLPVDRGSEPSSESRWWRRGRDAA